MKKILLTFVIILSVIGCGVFSVPLGDPKNDAELKTFKTAPDKAGIYIYRNMYTGPALKLDVFIDGQLIGKTSTFTYLYNYVSPGKHTISSSTFNPDTLEIEVKQGSLTYIWQEVLMSPVIGSPDLGSKLHIVSEDEGKKGVLETQLAAYFQPSLERSKNLPSSIQPVNEPSIIAAAPLNFKKNSHTALVIGNSAYKFAPPLKNPANDASDISAVLKKLGFDVTTLLNASQQEMDEAIGDLGRRLAGGGVGLFFYAGHGAQVNGENYLLPVDANLKSEADVKYKAVNAGQVLTGMGEARNGMNIVILDACRDNPFPRSYRSSKSGLAEMEAPKGSIIAFATAPGNTALGMSTN